MISPLLTGFFLGASLIIAIGAQNAFILRQGLLREHVFLLCLLCAASDALLIALGVAGLGKLIEQSTSLLFFIRIAGAAFLLWYAGLALRRAMKPQSLELAQRSGVSLRAALSICLAFTFLNPHVYLDTVVLIGSLSAQYTGQDRLVYAIGAMLASFVWFFSLGYGARFLQPVFQKPRSWQILDLVIAIVMFLIAFSLLVPFLG